MKTTMPRAAAALYLALAAASLVACSATPDRAVIEENVRTYTSTVAAQMIRAGGHSAWSAYSYGTALDKQYDGGRTTRDGLEWEGRRYCDAFARGVPLGRVVDEVWADSEINPTSLGREAVETEELKARLAGEILCPAR